MSAGAESRGPGPFVTHRLRARPDGRHVVATSRRHRKGSRPHVVPTAEAAEHPRASQAGALRHVLVWTPDMVGCACFLVASYVAYAEVSQCVASLAPRSISWWIAVVNLGGSLAFQVSALDGLSEPGSADVNRIHSANVYTALGGLLYLVGS